MPTVNSFEKALSLIQNDKSKVLGMTVGKDITVTPGQQIPKADCQSLPSLNFKGLGTSKTFIAIGVDLDGPFPSFAVLSPILHWIQPGFKADATGNLTTSELFIVNYVGPGPPPGSSPHRYVFLLYEQPESFEGAKLAPAGGKEVGISGRMRWDLGKFKQEAGLGEVLAVNYFNSN